MRTTILALLITGLAATGFASLSSTASPPPNLDRAIVAQQALVAERPTDAQARNDLGNLLVLDGRGGEAEEAYRNALELSPDLISAHYNLGLLLAQQGERKAAVEQFRAVLAAEPAHAWAHYQLGAIYDARGSERRAVKEYAKAFRLDPQLAFPEVNPGVIDNGHVTEALLLAYRDLPTAAEAPKTYEQPSRIVSLMVEDQAQRAAKAAEGKMTAPGEVGDSMGGAVTEGAQVQGIGPRPSLPGAVDDAAAGTAEGDAGDPGRVLRPEDLEQERGLNQAAPSGATSGSYFPPRGGVRTPPRTYYQPPSNLNQGRPGGNSRTTQPPGGQQTRPNGTQRFIPGVPSTGRLDMELLPGPGEPAETVATPAG